MTGTYFEAPRTRLVDGVCDRFLVMSGPAQDALLADWSRGVHLLDERGAFLAELAELLRPLSRRARDAQRAEVGP